MTEKTDLAPTRSDIIRVLKTLREKFDEPCPIYWRWWYIGAMDAYLSILGVRPVIGKTESQKVQDSFFGFKYMRDESYFEKVLRIYDEFLKAEEEKQ